MQVGNIFDSFTVWVGGIYRFKTLALNAAGPSDFSQELIVALAQKPMTMSAVTFDQNSNQVQLTVHWV